MSKVVIIKSPVTEYMMVLRFQIYCQIRIFDKINKKMIIVKAPQKTPKLLDFFFMHFYSFNLAKLSMYPRIN